MQDLLKNWKSFISEAQYIFIRAKNSNRALLNFDAKVLDLKDDRIRNIPFTTGRPTVDELKRCFKELVPRVIDAAEVEDLMNQVEIDQDEESKIQDLSIQESIENSTEKQQISKKEEITPEKDIETRQMLHFNRISDIVRRGKLNLIISQLNGNPILGNMSDEDGNTLLHVAALSDQPEILKYLLEFGLDATILNSKKQTPYQASTSKQVRDAFRRFIAYNTTSWDVSLSFIPEPLTKEMEEKQKAKAKQKRSKKKTADPPVEANVSTEEMNDTPKPSRGALPRLGISLIDTVGMSSEARMRLDREKRALAAERRINPKSCSHCGRDCSLNFFEKNNLWFCSTKCIKDSRSEKNV